MKVFYAWEIGEDLGHITSFLPVALELRQRGHDVVTALRELPRAENIFGRHGFTMLQAPLWQGTLVNPPRPPVSYAELLFFFGYLNAPRLTAMIRAWTALMSLVAPDLLIADHAPTALIAARVLGIPRATIGPGFELPPTTSPLPSMRPWLEVASERLMQGEQRVLTTINAAMEALSAQPLERLSDVFEGAQHFLITLSELDPYASRDGAQYYGPIFAPEKEGIPEWPRGRGQKVFAYLKQHYQRLEGVFGVLAALGCRTAAFVGGLPKDRLGKIKDGMTTISDKPYDIERAASECDFGVCHAGHGTTCALLLAGKPLLLLPMQLEQYLTAKRVSEIGAGVMVEGEKPQSDFSAAASQIIGNPDFTRRAQGFAQRYIGHCSSSTVTRIADECEELVRYGERK